ncbi:MAG: metal-sensitive transcriptional regulator [Firmicutes bacterium]|nr:metal-sensitive transcriptional regulator [Bacillota bacterium]
MTSLDIEPDKLRSMIHRLRRIEGQARGLQKMLEEGRPCEDIITQLAAMRSALNKVGLSLVAENLAQCFQIEDENRRREALERVRKSFLQLL